MCLAFKRIPRKEEVVVVARKPVKNNSKTGKENDGFDRNPSCSLHAVLKWLWVSVMGRVWVWWWDCYRWDGEAVMGKVVRLWVLESQSMEMKLRVVGAYVLGVKMESPASVGWVLALCLGAWWFSRSKAKKKKWWYEWGGEAVSAWRWWLPSSS